MCIFLRKQVAQHPSVALRKIPPVSYYNSVWEGYLEGGPEVVEAPGDDDVVVAAHQGGHHGRAVPHSAEAGVDLDMWRSLQRPRTPRLNLFVVKSRTLVKYFGTFWSRTEQAGCRPTDLFNLRISFERFCSFDRSFLPTSRLRQLRP